MADALQTLCSLMALTPIRITALRHSAFYSPLLYTINSGLLQSQGLQPYYAPGTPDNPAVEQAKDESGVKRQDSLQLMRGEVHLIN